MKVYIIKTSAGSWDSYQEAIEELGYSSFESADTARKKLDKIHQEADILVKKYGDILEMAYNYILSRRVELKKEGKITGDILEKKLEKEFENYLIKKLPENEKISRPAMKARYEWDDGFIVFRGAFNPCEIMEIEIIP